MKGIGGLLILCLLVVLAMNLPIGGQTLMQRARAGGAEAARYAASRAG